MRQKSWFAVATAIGLVISSAALAAETALEKLTHAGVVRVGFANESPYSFKQPDGSLGGLDYEVVASVFKKLGINEVAGVSSAFGGLVPGLKAGQTDVIAAGLFIRPARCKEIAFSIPALKVGDTFVVQKGNPKNLHGYADLIAQPGTIMGTLQGGSGEKTALAAGVPQDQISAFTDFSELYLALKTKRIDAVSMNVLSANEAVASDASGGIERASPFNVPVVNGKPAVNYLGFGFRKDDDALVSAFNQAFSAFRQSPEYKAILAKYFVTDAEIPESTVKLDDLCKE